MNNYKKCIIRAKAFNARAHRRAKLGQREKGECPDIGDADVIVCPLCDYTFMVVA